MMCRSAPQGPASRECRTVHRRATGTRRFQADLGAVLDFFSPPQNSLSRQAGSSVRGVDGRVVRPSPTKKEIGMKTENQNQRAGELAPEELESVAGGGLLHVVRVFILGGTSSAPGGTGTDSGPTATNPQIWVTYAS